MSPSKKKKRISILKKPTIESPEATATGTIDKPKKGILFSGKNTVKEFIQCDEKSTIWGSTYETSIARSDGSSDGSQISKKLSFDFTSSSIHATSTITDMTSMVLDSDKENLIIPATIESEKENFVSPPTPKDSVDRKSSSLNNSSGLTDMTVMINADERKRIKTYGTENLNVTSHVNLEMSLTKTVKASEESMVLSPRKTIFFNDHANISVCVQDKVLVRESEAMKKNISESISFTLDEDEKLSLKSTRKTVYKSDDMDLTLETLKLAEPKPALKAFKQPETPKPFRMAPRFQESVESPPIKPPKLENQKKVLDELMEFLVNETPTKNLCRQMCTTKKHSITPLQDQPPAKFPASDKPESPKSRNDSMKILKELGLDIDTPEAHRNAKEKTNRQTVFDASIAVEATELPSPVKEARKTLFEEEMNETLSQKTEDEWPKASQETFFDLPDETVATTKGVQLMKLKDIKRKTVYDNDISFTCNFADMAAYKASSTMMNYTNMDETEVSESTNELARRASRLLKNPMATTASTSSLFSKSLQQNDDINISPHQRSMPVENNVRKTVYDANMSLNLDLSKNELYKDSPLKFLSNNDIEISGIELTAPEVPEIQKQRMTIYADESIQAETPEVAKLKPKNPRMTIYADQSIQEETPEVAELKPKNPRMTIYADQSIQAETPEVAELKPKNPRMTIYADESIQAETPEVAKSKLINPRMTIYADQSIQEEIPEVAEKSSRMTICGNDTITETATNQPQRLKRGTIFGCNAMDETNINTLSLEIEAKKDRVSIYEDSPIYEETSMIGPPTVEVKNRKTIHAPFEMNVTIVDEESEISVARRANLAQSIEPLELSQTFNSGSQFTSTSFDIKDSVSRLKSQQVEKKSLSPSCISPPPGFDSPFHAALGQTQNEKDLTEDLTFRKSVIVSRKTVYEAVDMEVDAKDVGEQTFSVRRDDSKKLMNVTDADILSLIDDESNPCINESTQSNSSRFSIGANSSAYQNALQEFINITIKESPLNNTTYVPTPAPGGRARNRVIHEPIDYCAKFNDLIGSLNNEDEPAPRLEIDEFLEKRNIRPVRIPFFPQLQSDWLPKEYEKIKERIAKNEIEREKRIAAAQQLQQPLIPSRAFLFRNKLDNLDEEVRLEIAQESRPPIAPVFPLLCDFDFLLKNKFETDDHLSKFWELDLLWTWKNQYKLSHKLLQPFKINFGVRNPSGNLNDSSIPIYFEKVLMYVHPDYRGKISLKKRFLMNEFKRAIGTDIFTPMCSSTSQLFSFLDSFHQQVLKTVEFVDVFFSIIYKNSAIIERNIELNTIHILKRHFSQDDIVDIKIALYSSIEDTTISCITVKSHTRYAYELQPRQPASEPKGLMLIEIVLFNVEKFLRDNTRRIQLE